MDGLAQPRRGSRQCGPSPWTDERIEYVKARWSRGVTARQIAHELGGGVTKSAVLGKIHRLGIAELSPNAWPRRWRRGAKNGVTSSAGRLNAPSAGFVRANNGCVRSG